MLILPLSTPSSGGLPPGVTSPGDGALNYVTGALTASRPSINVVQTWNNAAVPFDAFTVSVTNTASSGQSTVSRWLVDGLPVARILRDGYVIATAFTGNFEWAGLLDGAGSGNGLRLSSSNPIAWTSGSKFWNTADLFLFRDGPGIFNQRNAANAQTYRLERTFTDGSNRGYTDFAQDAAGGLRLNSVWTGGVAAPTNLLDVQGNGTSALVLQSIFGGAVSRLQKTASEPGALEFEGGNGQIYYNKNGIRSFGLGQDETRVRDLSGLTFGTDGRPGQGSITARFISPSSGLIEINNGTAGQFRDLRLRNLAAVGGTVTASTPLLTLSQTWNSAPIAFDADLMDITDTASAAGSTLLNRRLNGANRLNLRKDGRLTIAGGFFPTDGLGSFNGLSLILGSDAAQILMGANSDANFYRGGPGVIAQRNGLNPQAYELFNRYTDPSNFERGFVRWVGNNFEIGTETLAGTVREMVIRIGGNEAIRFNIFGPSLPASGYFGFSGRSGFSSPADGMLMLRNAAGTSFDRLLFGGTDGSTPALKRSGAALQVRLANDSGFTNIEADRFIEPNQRTAIASSRNVTALDDGKILDCAAGVTLTVPTGLSPMPSFIVVPPATGSVTIACSGGATLNGGTASISYTLAARPVGFLVMPTQTTNAYGVS